MGRKTVGRVIRERPLLVGVTLAYVTGWSVYGFANHRRPTVVYLATLIVLFAMLALVHARVGFSTTVLWLLSAWGFFHLAGGLVPVGAGVLYNASLGNSPIQYDRVVHAIGFGTATVACWQALKAAIPTVVMSPGVAILVAFMGMGVGALNDVVEFFAAQTFAANVGGFLNTGWDLVANLLGCAAAAAWLERRLAAKNGLT